MVHLFNEGFTPLFKVGISTSVIKEDLLDIKYCHASRGPKGHCFSRSKYFLHDNDLFRTRIIFNREKLSQRYRIYPFDEVNLSKTKDDKIGWYSNNLKFHKASFPLKNNSDGKKVRQPRHGLTSVSFKECLLEQEFEERILSNIPNLGRYIYAINFWDDKYINNYCGFESSANYYIVKNYLEKYPHIKVLSGYTKFEDKTNLFC